VAFEAQVGSNDVPLATAFASHVVTATILEAASSSLLAAHWSPPRLPPRAFASTAEARPSAATSPRRTDLRNREELRPRCGAGADVARGFVRRRPAPSHAARSGSNHAGDILGPPAPAGRRGWGSCASDARRTSGWEEWPGSRMNGSKAVLALVCTLRCVDLARDLFVAPRDCPIPGASWGVECRSRRLPRQADAGRTETISDSPAPSWPRVWPSGRSRPAEGSNREGPCGPPLQPSARCSAENFR
jgi:hypothetical protein